MTIRTPAASRIKPPIPPMESLRIAILLPGELPVPCTQGGAIESTIQLLIDQNEMHKRLRITVFSPYEKSAKKLSTDYVFTCFRWIPRGKILSFVNIIFKIVRRVVWRNLDLLDCQILKKYFLQDYFDRIIIHGNTLHLLAIAKVVPKDKIVFYTHANLFEERSRRNLHIGSSAGRYISVSHYIKQKVIENAGVPEECVTVIKNPIDLGKFSESRNIDRPRDLAERFSIRPHDTVVLFVGRLVEGKGVLELLLAIKSLSEEIAVKLLVIGTFGSKFAKGHEPSPYQKKVADLAMTLENRVHLVGFVPNIALPGYHSLADIIVMPSLCEEAAGKVAMEGMASGLPVICTNAGGIPEYVTDRCAIYVNRDDKIVASLAAAIKRLIQNPDLRRTMGASGAAISEDFSPQIYYKNYLNMASGGQEMMSALGLEVL